MIDPRRKGVSPIVAGLVGFGALVVITAVTVVLSVAPAPPMDLAVITALVVAIELIGIALNLVWRRITRTRRQYRNSG